MSEISYRRFEERDRDSVLSLFESAFGKQRDRAQWEWEFLSGPKPALIVVAETDKKIVGHYAILHRRIKAGDEVLSSGLVVDVMTHPDFGKRGIFVNSGLEGFRQANKEGVEMLIGFPNEAAIRGHLKVGWNQLGYVTVRARPLKADSIRKMAEGRLRIPRFVATLIDAGLVALNRISLGDARSDLAAEWISPDRLGSISHEFKDLVDRCSSLFLVGNSRNIDWYEWRLSDPLCRSSIVLLRQRSSNAIHGLGVLKVKMVDGMKTGAIMDLVCHDSDPMIERRLLQQLLVEAVSQGCEVLVALTSPAARRQRIMTRMFILPTPRRLRFIVRSTDGQRLPAAVYRLENWHLEFIDHDVI